ncbi:hypothetical protein BCR44DRAFT_1425947 [Catenaria anguillulae PL171]|uniref:Uncharacterized protein n=1 Tax=Catenaria anguillulae PL171 TaxID=765915 RepID=A0A1Y2HZA7_9FUNG|nr:hypothetical protein BCR44DRAFT_1425947 [Catenaria anguillulae PL171]
MKHVKLWLGFGLERWRGRALRLLLLLLLGIVVGGGGGIGGGGLILCRALCCRVVSGLRGSVEFRGGGGQGSGLDAVFGMGRDDRELEEVKGRLVANNLDNDIGSEGECGAVQWADDNVRGLKQVSH